MGKDRKPLGTLAVVALAALLLSAVALAVDVDAAKGGRGGGRGGKNGGTTATMTVTPNQVPLGSPSVTISGSGFASGQDLVINTSMFPQPRVTTDGTGSFSIVYSPDGGFTYPGPASVQALRSSDLLVLATAAYTVCSASGC